MHPARPVSRNNAWKVSSAYKKLATALLVANGAVSATELVLVVVTAEAGEFPGAPVQRDLRTLAAIFAGLPASA